MSRVVSRVLAVPLVLLLACSHGFAAAREAPAYAGFRSDDGHQVRLAIWGGDPDRPGRPAIVFFHGGGWVRGNARQFAPFCQAIVTRHMVCISVDYTLRGGDSVLAEGAEAIAWTRAHARELGVDPRRIAAGGGSVGGYLAASTAILSGTADGASRPDALVLLNPIIGRFGSGPAFDLTDRLSQPLPPTLIIHGTADRVSPIAGVERFAAKAKSAGSPDVRVIEYPQRGHGFWNFQGGRNPDFGTTEAQIAGFFDRIGWK